MEACVRPLNRGWVYGLADEYGLHQDRNYIHFGLIRELNELNNLFPRRGWCGVGTTIIFPHLEDKNVQPPSLEHVDQINAATQDKETRYKEYNSFTFILPWLSLSRFNLDKPFHHEVTTREGYEERLDLIVKYLGDKKENLRADADVLDILVGLASANTDWGTIGYQGCNHIKIEGLEVPLQITTPASKRR